MKTKKVLLLPIILALAWIVWKTPWEIPNIPTIGIIVWYVEEFFIGILIAIFRRKRKINWRLGWWAVIPFIITTEWIMGKTQFQILQLSPIAMGMAFYYLSLGTILRSIGLYILAIGFIMGSLIFFSKNQYR